MPCACSVLSATAAVMSVRVGTHAQGFSLLVHTALHLDLLQLKTNMQAVHAIFQNQLYQCRDTINVQATGHLLLLNM